MNSTINHNPQRQQGEQLHQLCERLFPICRSITGNGVRQTLQILQEYINLDIVEVPSGSPVLDWTIPKEWNIKAAWIKDPQGNKIIDFDNNNLHILNYSIPTHQQLDLDTLKNHLFSLPDHPDWIPYRTSYYKEQWGFCLTHRQLEQLREGNYEVYIDSTLGDGHLSYGELYIPGEREEELLFTAHVCHPSLANDNLSGISILTQLAQHLSRQKNNYSYRFLFIPGTIGSITWLSRNKEKLHNVKGGLVASLLGDAGDFTYKKSRRGNTEMDILVEEVLSSLNLNYRIIDFIPYGYDERQLCAPAFDLAIGNLTRSQFGTYPEYHTSADNLDLIQPEYLEESFRLYRSIIEEFESRIFYKNRFPEGEPQLGKRGLYDAIGGDSDSKEKQMAMLWILNLSDGQHSLQHIAKKSGYAISLLLKVSELLLQKGVLEKL